MLPHNDFLGLKLSEIATKKQKFQQLMHITLPPPRDLRFYKYLVNYECQHSELYKETIFKDDGVISGNELFFNCPKTKLKLNRYFNNPQILSLIEELTGFNNLIKAEARLKKLTHAKQMFLGWHHDANVTGRVVAMRVELSTKKYEGGVFKVRCSNTQKLIFEIPQLRFGESYITDISKNQYEHCVSKVLAKSDRTSIIIWFYQDSKKA